MVLGTSILGLVAVVLLPQIAAVVDGQHARPVFGHIQSALIEDRNTICRTVQICHDSRTNSGARTIFDAYHSLASKLQLKPLADFVHVSQQHKQTCIRNGCCCSSPVTVQVSIPLTGDEAADLKNLAILADFDKLPKQLAGAFCSGQLKECYQPLSMERRRLLSDTAVNPDVTYETAVIPVPEMPTGITPGTTDVLEEGAAAMTVTMGPTGTYGEQLAGHGSYGSHTQQGKSVVGALGPPIAGRSLLAKSAGSTNALTLSVVPAGTYGEDAASYGSYGSYEKQAAIVEAHKLPTAGRSLLAQAELSLNAIQLRSSSLTSCPPCPTCTAAAVGPHHSTSSTLATLLGAGFDLPGSCYCQYDSSKAAWALADPTCKSALFSRCGSAGTLLECAQVEAFYSHSHPATRSMHKGQISAFLFVDCPPAPPCSCRAVWTADAADTVYNGGTKAAGLDRCCGDLRAHCQVPFSGLDCAEVARFCSSHEALDLAQFATIHSYVEFKTHNLQCSELRSAVAYTVGASRLAAAASAVRDSGDSSEGRLLHNAMQQNIYFRADWSSMSTAVVILLTLMGSCLFTAVVLAGVISLVQQYGITKCIVTPANDWSAYQIKISHAYHH